VLASRGINHHLDDWGPKGGHEWPYWHHQMWEYIGAHYWRRGSEVRSRKPEAGSWSSLATWTGSPSG